MNLDDFQDDIIEEYNLRKIATKDGCVIAECKKCVYGLPQAGILANKYLEKRLNEYGYFQSDFTNGLWAHKSRPIQFALCVDDFGVKYVKDEDVEHLKAALTATNPETGKPMFEIMVDKEGKQFCGLHQATLMRPSRDSNTSNQRNHKINRTRTTPNNTGPRHSM
jgi:hypothetical protein